MLVWFFYTTVGTTRLTNPNNSFSLNSAYNVYLSSVLIGAGIWYQMNLHGRKFAWHTYQKPAPDKCFLERVSWLLRLDCLVYIFVKKTKLPDYTDCVRNIRTKRQRNLKTIIRSRPPTYPHKKLINTFSYSYHVTICIATLVAAFPQFVLCHPPKKCEWLRA